MLHDVPWLHTFWQADLDLASSGMCLTSYDVMRIAPTSAGSGIQTSFPKGKCAKNDVHRMTPVHAGAVIIERRASDKHILEFVGFDRHSL